MEDILQDSNNTRENSSAPFSKLAFAFSLLGSASLLILSINTILIIRARGGHPTITTIASLSLLFIVLFWPNI